MPFGNHYLGYDSVRIIVRHSTITLVRSKQSQMESFVIKLLASSSPAAALELTVGHSELLYLLYFLFYQGRIFTVRSKVNNHVF